VAVATRSIGDPEGGEPGYLLLYFRGDDFALAHVPVDRRGPVVLATHPRDRLLATTARHVVAALDRVVARAWPDPGVVAVRARVDEGPWVDLNPQGDGHWSAPLPGHDLAKGEHPLEVVARDADGADTPPCPNPGPSSPRRPSAEAQSGQFLAPPDHRTGPRLPRLEDRPRRIARI